MGADVGEEMEEKISASRIILMLLACSCPINQMMEALRSGALPRSLPISKVQNTN